MTSLLTNSTDLFRGAAAAPDFAAAGSSLLSNPIEYQPNKQPIQFPEAVPQSDEAALRTAQFDAAIELNRANTPQSVVNQRKAPRYSVRALNGLSDEQVRERLTKLDRNDDRPGIAKVLDLVDAPRNFIGNVVAEHFVPEAKRMAQKRGDFTTFGQLHVTGGDLLRAMGVENRVVNAIGGFAVDILTDPLSFIGGPIGGLTQTGARGSIQLSNQGSRLIRSSINSIRKGGTVANPWVRSAIEDTLTTAVKLGHLDEAADAATKATYLRDALLGSTTRIGDAAGRVGLGRVTNGGLLVEDTFRAVANDATDDISNAIAKRAESIKAFTRKYANNNGLDLTRGRGGAEIAHFPLTSKTLTVPAFNIPGIGPRFGQRAEMQVAASQFVRGNLPASSIVLRASGAATGLNESQRELNQLHDLRRTMAASGADADELAAIEERINSVVQRIAGQREAVAAIDKMQPEEIARSFGNPENLGDLMVMADAYQDAAQMARLAERNAKWVLDERGAALIDEAGNPIPRVTREDVRAVRRERDALRDELIAQGQTSVDSFTDDLVDPARQSQAFRDIVQAKREQSALRVRNLLTQTEQGLRDAEQVADAFQGVVEAAQRVADLRLGHVVRSAMSSDQRMLAEGARMMLGVSDQQLGHLPFQSLDSFFQSSGRLGMSSRVNEFGRKTAINFGTNKGVLNDVIRNLSHDVTSGATERANQTLKGVVDRIEAAINRAPNVKGSDFDEINTLAFLRVEQELIERAKAAGFVEFAGRATGGTKKARELLENAQKAGLLSDEALRNEIDSIAREVADYFEEVGRQAVLAGDISSPLAVYAPVLLKQEAAKRAELLRRSGGRGSERAAELLDAAGGPGGFDPTKRRVTNMVEFTDRRGKQHAFTVAEGGAYAGIDDGLIASMREQGRAAEAANAERVREGVAAFKQAKGLPESLAGDALTEAMQGGSRPMLPSELNDYAQSGALDPIVGGVISGHNQREFFETSLTNMLYTRARAHEIARAKDSFRDVIEPFIVIDGLPRNSLATVQNAEGVTATGEKFKIIGNGTRIRLGRNTYRRIDSLQETFPHDSALNIDSMLRGKHGAGYIPEQLAVQLERLADRMRPEPMGDVLRAAERVTSLFRTTTLAHPSWAVTNTVGNMFLAGAMGLLDPKRAPQFIKNMGRAIRIHTQENLDNLSMRSVLGRAGRKSATKIGMREGDTIIVGGAPMRIDDLLSEIGQNGVKQTISGDQYDLLFNHVARSFPGLQTQPKTAFGRSFRQSIGEMSARQTGGGRLQRAGNTVAAASHSFPVERAKGAIKTWFEINGTLDQIFRTAAYITVRNEGLDPISAAREVRKGMLNFGDLSSFESNVIRPLIPFYSWVKASLPNILVRSIKDPKLLSSVPKITEGLEALTAGEDRVPQHLRPRWIQETMGIQIGTDPETRSAFLLGTLLPQEGALQALSGAGGALGLFGGKPLDFDGQDFLDTVNWGVSQFSPVVKLPVELGLQRETFSGRDIGVEPGQGEIGLTEYLTNQLRPIKEFGLGLGRGSVTQAFERSTAEGVSRLAAGGRVQPALQQERLDTARFFTLKDQEADLRKAIRLAEKQGEEEQAVKLRFRLLQTYTQFVADGGDPSDIPKWAREDIEAYAAVSRTAP